MSRKTIVEKVRIPLSRLFAAAILALLLLTGSHWEAHTRLAELFTVAGLVLVGLAVVGRLTCAIYISGRKTTELVVDGPYAWTRNPLYFFSLLGTLGLGLVTKTFTVPLLLVGFFALYYLPVILSEERRLAQAHGEAFARYRASVPRFFPRRPQRPRPATVEISPGIFRKHGNSAIWFVWATALVILLQTLRHLELLPTLAYLY